MGKLCPKTTQTPISAFTAVHLNIAGKADKPEVGQLYAGEQNVFKMFISLQECLVVISACLQKTLAVMIIAFDRIEPVCFTIELPPGALSDVLEDAKRHFQHRAAVLFQLRCSTSRQ